MSVLDILEILKKNDCAKCIANDSKIQILSTGMIYFKEF
jgi:hypothetical protein